MHKQNRKPCVAIEGIKKYTSKFKKSVKPCLLKNSQNFCSYCDCYQDNDGNLLIEHFKGRTKFPELEAEYSNLYAACFSCNNRKKDENYPTSEPLRPDNEDYDFDKYFYFEPDKGEIIALNENAEITLNFLNLNNSDIKKARINFCTEWKKKGERPGKSFRFIELKVISE